jgi:multiple sugar transport system substrate-binding protein
MKKLIALLMMSVLVLGLFAGCASPAPEAPAEEPAIAEEAPAEEEAEAPSEKQAIKFVVQADSTAALETLVAAYNDSQDMYEVEAIVLTNDSGNMHDQIINSLSAKSSEYDIISMDVVWAGEFAAAGYLEPLDMLIRDNGWKPTDFNAGSMSSGKYKGKNYALPYFPDLGFLYYRSDIVSAEDQAMLEGGDYTFETLLALAEKYQGEGGTKFGHVYQSKQYEGLTCNVNEFTANWTNVEEGLKTMKMFADSKATPDDILTYTEGETHAAFLNGDTVFARNWPYMSGMAASGEYNVKSEQVGFAPLPAGGTVGGWIVGINGNSENKDGAADFITFLAGPEGQKINATTGGYLPGFNALLEDSSVVESNALLTNAGFKKALSMTIARPVVANYSEVSDAIQVKSHEFLSDNGELTEAVTTIEEKLQ